MWTVVHIATNMAKAKQVKEKLEAEGLLVNLRPISGERREESAYVEVLVPESEAEEAHEIINEYMGV